MNLSDIQISTKLPFIFAFMLLFFVGVIFFFVVVLADNRETTRALQQSTMKTRSLGQDVLIHTLQARRGEKDFLMRQDDAYRERTEREINAALQVAATIKGLNREPANLAIAEKGSQIDGLLRRYGEKFQDVATSLKKKGYAPGEGLQGTFREASHRLDTALMRFHTEEFYDDWQELALVERDHLLHRQEGAGQLKFNEMVRSMTLRIAASALSEKDKVGVTDALTNYAREFNILMAEVQHIDGLVDDMRQTVQPIEPLAEEILRESDALAKRHEKIWDEAFLHIFHLIIVVSLIVVLVCGLLVWRIVTGITRSLSDLYYYSCEVAGGNLEAQLTVQGQDEIAHLAEMIREMVYKLQSIRLIADRMVLIMVLISQGIIPEKIEGDFHGDYKVISNALNGMIDSLGEIRMIANQLYLLSQGVTPAKVEGEYSGEFKRMVDALNQLNDQLRVFRLQNLGA